MVALLCGTGDVDCDSARGAESNEHRANEALKVFQRRVLAVTEDKRTGLFWVSITWRDRYVAASWANEYVALANRELQSTTVAESSRRIAFLRDAAEKAESIALHDAIYKLMESEIKSTMIASTRKDYAFKIIDPALAPDQRDTVRPRRALLTLFGVVFGSSILAAFTNLLWRRANRVSLAGSREP